MCSKETRQTSLLETGFCLGPAAYFIVLVVFKARVFVTSESCSAEVGRKEQGNR